MIDIENFYKSSNFHRLSTLGSLSLEQTLVTPWNNFLEKALLKQIRKFFKSNGINLKDFL